MNIEQLHYFLHVAESGSINSTAQKFYLTQQAVSASIKKMEAELDTTLIQRTHKGVTLTPQGHIFVEHAKELVQQYDVAVCALQKYNASARNLQGRITVFSASIFTNSFLPEVIHDFRQIYPDTQIQIIDIEVQNLLPCVLEHYCDIALFSVSKSYLTSQLASHPDIKTVSLAQDHIGLCMRPEHPLYRDKSISLKALDSDGPIQDDDNCKLKYKYSLYYVLTENALYPNICSASVSNSGNTELHKKLITEGLAITYMPYMAYLYEFKNDGYAFRPIQDSYQITHCLLYQDVQTNENAELIQIFADFTKKQFQKKYGISTCD